MNKIIIGLFLLFVIVSCTSPQNVTVATPIMTSPVVAVTSTLPVSSIPSQDFPVIPVPIGMVYYQYPTIHDSHEQWWVMTENGPLSILERLNGKGPNNPVVSHDRSWAAYVGYGNVWLINLLTNEKKQLTNLPVNEYSRYIVWSPNDQYLVYEVFTLNESGKFTNIDLWRVNVQSGENINLPNTKDGLEQIFDIAWQSDSILFSTWNNNTMVDSCFASKSASLLTQVNLDGSKYKIIDFENGIFYRPSVSADGNSIAYDLGRIYQNNKVATLNPKDFDFDFSEGMALVLPSWSPNGTKIAWVIVDPEHTDYISTVFFELVSHSAKLITKFKPYWDDGVYPCETFPIDNTFYWSPDGQWLAVSSIEVEENQINKSWRMPRIRIFNMSGVEITSLDEAYHPFWSPNGKWLAFVRDVGKGITTIQMIEAGTWKIWQLDVPENTTIIDW